MTRLWEDIGASFLRDYSNALHSVRMYTAFLLWTPCAYASLQGGVPHRSVLGMGSQWNRFTIRSREQPLWLYGVITADREVSVSTADC